MSDGHTGGVAEARVEVKGALQVLESLVLVAQQDFGSAEEKAARGPGVVVA
ncbi:hypothetical protein [Nocardia gipuzkoensis]